MNIEKEEKKKGRLLSSLFALMITDFLITFVAVGFLGFSEINIVPKAIISFTGFIGYFIFVIFCFFVLAFLTDFYYKDAIKRKQKHWNRFLGIKIVIGIYVFVVSLNLLNIIDVLK